MEMRWEWARAADLVDWFWSKIVKAVLLMDCSGGRWVVWDFLSELGELFKVPIRNESINWLSGRLKWEWVDWLCRRRKRSCVIDWLFRRKMGCLRLLSELGELARRYTKWVNQLTDRKATFILLSFRTSKIYRHHLFLTRTNYLQQLLPKPSVRVTWLGKRGYYCTLPLFIYLSFPNSFPSPGWERQKNGMSRKYINVAMKNKIILQNDKRVKPRSYVS